MPMLRAFLALSMSSDNQMTIQTDKNIANTCKNNSKVNCFKTKTLRKHHKANRTLRVGVKNRGLKSY